MNVLVLAMTACTGSGPGASGADSGCVPSPWYADTDGDGFGSGAATTSCVAPSGHVATSGDCDDTNPAVNPGAAETCNGVDDDCDGTVDPAGSGGSLTCYWDGDADGFGTTSATFVACSCDKPYASDPGDCDDTDSTIYPGADDTWYDDIDQDCAGNDDWDADGDGFDAGTTDTDDCDDLDPSVNPGATEICGNGVDDDCDGDAHGCGIVGNIHASDADLRIERDPDNDPRAWWGDQAIMAGDADGDGLGEIVSQIMYDSDAPEAYSSGYLLLEPPAEGVVHPDDVLVGSWIMNDRLWTLGGGEQPAVAGVDLDLDGHLDYAFSSMPDNYGPEARVDLWLGPASGTMNLDEGALTITSPPDPTAIGLTLGGPLALLEPPREGDDWVLAAGLLVSLEPGDARPLVALLGPQAMQGDEGWDDIVEVWSPGGDLEGSDQLEVADFDGDGIADIASCSRPAVDIDPPPGEVWVQFGPIEGDMTTADADVTLRGGPGATWFGRYITVVDRDAADGRPRLLVVQVSPDIDTPWMVFDVSTADNAGPDDAVAALATTDRYGVGIDVSDLGNLMADGGSYLGVSVAVDDVDEALAVLALPDSGVVEVSDADAMLWGDADGDFGHWSSGGQDLDGDGFVDVMVAEPGWDDTTDPYVDSQPWGRLVVFHGGPTGF